ncbi:MAG: hypothetical protein WCL34_10345, partial [Methylococcaceae bacterium]
MFDDKFFEDWLDSQAQSVMTKISTGEGISPEQMMILMLKAQTNHFAHLDVELREDMKSMNERLSSEMKTLRQDMDKRFEQVDKRFEQVDKRFEQVDKRFEQLTSRIDRFMIWSFAVTISV